jgi:nucleoside-diphosphate-sugar epimerase
VISAATQRSPAPAWRLEDDLDDVRQQVGASWERLRGARIFFTGGTGFIGKWLLASLILADERGGLGVEAMVLTRDAAAFQVGWPQMANHPAVTLVEGNVTSFDFPMGAFTHVVHAATDASAHLNEHDPLRMFDTIVSGTRHVLDFCVAAGAPRVLSLSSGAVYGRQPPELRGVPEDFMGAPDCLAPVDAYGEGKRAAEMLGAIFAKQHGLEVVTARIFAALGPHLPLGIHYAAGNFIQDAMAGRPIVVKGNGLAERSYLYAGDLAVWLWRLLLEGRPGAAYNVGSERAVSIRDLAEVVALSVGSAGFEVLGERDLGWNPGRYAPDTGRIRRELGVSETVDLAEAVRRTALWNGWTPWPS